MTTIPSAPPLPAGPQAPPARGRSGTSDDRLAQFLLAAVGTLVLAVMIGMFVFVLVKAWPSFSGNGLGWFGNGETDRQLELIFKSPASPEAYVYEIGALPLLVGTIITSIGAVTVGLVFSIFTAIFIVEFAPERLLSPPWFMA